MPQFPWPPPRWTSRTVLPQALAITRSGDTLGAIFDRLRAAVDRAGLEEWSVYSVGDDGFAIIARLENIDDKGRPAQPRFQAGVGRAQIFSISDYLTALLRARPGRYRVIAVVVTARPVSAGSTAATAEMMRNLLVGGAGTLAEALRGMPASSSVHCEALVYEFFRATEDEQPAQVLDGALTARDHLVGASLWSAEELR